MVTANITIPEDDDRIIKAYLQERNLANSDERKTLDGMRAQALHLFAEIISAPKENIVETVSKAVRAIRSDFDGLQEHDIDPWIAHKQERAREHLKAVASIKSFHDHLIRKIGISGLRMAVQKIKSIDIGVSNANIGTLREENTGKVHEVVVYPKNGVAIPDNTLVLFKKD